MSLNLLELSVTDLHAILGALEDAFNKEGTSQTYDDYFKPLYNSVYDALCKNPAQSPMESLIKVTTLVKDNLANDYSYGAEILKEAQSFTEVSA